MRLKRGCHSGAEGKMTSKNVCCPVCKHYLRKDASLHVHINSHPKEQVIETLIKLKDACNISNSSGLVQERNSLTSSNASSSLQPENNPEGEGAAASTISHHDRDDLHRVGNEIVESATSASPPQYTISTCIPSTSSGRIVPYTPFMPGSTPVPQFIHVPVVTSVVPNQVSPSPAQTPVVLYTPFVCPPGSSESVINSSPQLHSSRHLPFLTNNLMRPPYSIIQTCTNPDVPQVTPLTISQAYSDVKVEGSAGHMIFMHSNQSRVAGSEYSSATFCSVSHSQDDDDDHDTPLELTVKPDHQRIESEESGNEEDHNTSCGLRSSIRKQQSSPPLDCRTSQDREMVSPPPKKRRCPEMNDRHSPGDSIAECPPKPHLSSCGESVLRLRSNLNISQKNVAVQSNNWPIELSTSLKQEANNSLDCDEDSCPAGGSNFHSKQLEECDSTESTCIDPSDFLVTHLEASSVKEDDFRDDCSLGRPGTPPCESAPPSPYEKSLDSPATPLNIQTDETMPPRGELSEQESIGGNSSSMWSVPAYHTSRELTSPVVSYDLTARESWPGSEMSDSEGNVNTSNQHYTSSPSFSNTLHPFIAKPTTDGNFVGESLFSSCLQPQANMESHETNKNPCSGGNKSKKSANINTPSSRIKKAPAKPRVYRCKECTTVFTTLKLRRLHPCEQMKSTNENASITVMKIASDLKVLSEENVSMPGSSRQEDGLPIKPKPKRKTNRKPKATVNKKELIVDDQSSAQTNFAPQYRISKAECEENAEPRTRIELPAALPSKEDESSAFETAASNVVTDSSDVMLCEETIKSANISHHTCEKCGQEFASAKMLSQHMSSKHKGQKYLCATCGDSFDKEREYYDHLMVHPLECQECGKTFTRRKYLVLHSKRHMEVKPHKCETCGKSFVTKQKLNEHQNTHTGNAPIKCPDCDESFRRYSNLIQHRNRYHLKIKPKVKDHICQCGEVFSSKKKLEWHKEIHDDKPKSCQYCSEKFVHTVSLTRHVRRTHDRSYVPKKGRESENIECPVCRLVFLKSSLATHIKIHSGERPYPCHICGKDFTTKWNLQLHRWTHASRSSRPFKCTLCKSAFYRKQDYHSHMHSHRNVRPYTCNHCGCQFLRKYNCIRHMREHEEGKNFTCTICNKTFHRRYYLKDHMRVHSGTRPFTCHICGKASTSKSNHNKHVRIHHAREPQNAEI